MDARARALLVCAALVACERPLESADAGVDDPPPRHRPVECTAATQGDAAATAAGIESCDADTANRTTAAACIDDATPNPCLNGGDCASDAACSPPDSCVSFADTCTCAHVCSTDDDCGEGRACVCTAEIIGAGAVRTISAGRPHCVPAECRTNADCGFGPCGIVHDPCGRATALRCRSQGDECESNADCFASSAGTQCIADNGSAWRCGFVGTCG